MTDVSFLLNIAQKVKISSRDPLLANGQTFENNKRFGILSDACRKKNVRLFLLPSNMQKHIENQTFFDPKYTNSLFFFCFFSFVFGCH